MLEETADSIEEEEEGVGVVAEPIWYNKSLSNYKLDDFKIYFLKYGGLNPVKDSDPINFDFKVNQYVENSREKNMEEVLDSEVLKVVLYPEE